MFLKRILILAAFLLAARAEADTPSGSFASTICTKEEFRAIGSLTTQDNDVPPNGIDGPFVDVACENWTFNVKHIVANWEDDKAKGTKLGIKGTHTDGPHDIDIDPATLDLGLSRETDIDFNKDKKIAEQKVAAHPTSDSRGHFDIYAVRSTVTALEGPPNLVAGPTEIVAKHSGKKETALPKGLAAGSSSAGGSFLTYDAESGTLTFVIGPIDILDSSGGQSGAVDPAYDGDPILSGVISVENLKFQGISPDGGYTFSGGELRIDDPSGKFLVIGSFDSYTVRSTLASPVLSSFGLLSKLTVLDAGDPSDGPSPFLEDFVTINLLGQGLPQDEWLRIQGIGFTFTTSVDLAALTAGFTQSAANVPASYYLAANSIEISGLAIPTLSPLGLGSMLVLLASAGLWLLARRAH